VTAVQAPRRRAAAVNHFTGFIRRRGVSLALVVLVMALDALAQTTLSHTFAVGVLRGRLGINVLPVFTAAYRLRIGLLAVMGILWLLKRRRALFSIIIIVNGISTVALLAHTLSLLSVLAGLSARAATTLILDVVLMAVSNMLIFSVWYWVIDPPGVLEEKPRPEERWAFLFPQRAAVLPNFESWQPHYADYLFLAFTTSFAFSPTDTLPLTRAAKMVMLLQGTIAVITLTGVAGSAFSILAGGGSGG
jgi:hypothetical protein